MADLASRRCLPCNGDTPLLDPGTRDSLLSELPGWTIETDGAGDSAHHLLRKEFKFKDFISALGFVNRIAEVAEAEGHHPDLLLSWGKVRVESWTHSAGGLTEADFVLAAKIAELYAPA